MDENNQQQTGSDTLLKELESDTSIKGISDEKKTQELPRKTTCDASESDAVMEALNTNGIDKESGAPANNSFTKSDGELTESQESTVQDEKSSVDNPLSESNTEFCAASEGFSDNLEKCSDKTDNENSSGLGSGDKVESNVEDSSKGDVKVHQEVEASVDTTIDSLETQLNKSSESKECVTDLSKKSEFCENFKESDIISVKEKSPELNPENETNSLLIEGSREQTDSPPVFSKEGENIPSEPSVDESLIPIPTKEIINVTEDEDNNPKILESETDTSDDTSSSQITQVIPQETKNVEEEKEQKSTTCSTLLSSEKENSENVPSEGDKDENKINTVRVDTEQKNQDTQNIQLQSETESKIKESESEVRSKATDTSTTEPNSENEIKIPETENKEEQSKNKSQDLSDSHSDLETKSKNRNESQSEIEINESTSEDSPMEVTSTSEVTEPQKDKKFDQAEECVRNQKPSEHESKEENSNAGDKDKVQEHRDINRLNITSEHEEEHISRCENEMDTEMLNFNEIEQVNLNETDLKAEGRDEELVSDFLEIVVGKVSEGQITDERENSGETDKSAMLIYDEAVNQPGNSEEETITGDTTNQSTGDLSKERDDDICIIPDDVIPALTILPQNKEQDGDSLTVLKGTPPESLKPKTRAQDKRNQGSDSKSRPVRSAAKLAGNKIKSLVESDWVFDEQHSNTDLENKDKFQENTDETAQMCVQCQEIKVCKLLSVQNDVTHYLCSEQCSAAFKSAQMDVECTESDGSLRQFIRKCGQCHSQVTNDENRLFWETVDFCNEDCLGKYQVELGSTCANCKKSVPSISLGKYCVRFGYDIKQFCSALCIEEYKKGLKVCSYCQKDISTGAEGFMAPVGSKGQFKDFCTQSCMEKYNRMSSNKPLPDVIQECAVCSKSKPVQVEVELDNKTHKLCSEPCFAAFKFVNNITEGQCDMCRKYFDRLKIPNYSLRLLFYDEALRSFCSKTCMIVYILANRKIVACNWCKVKKYNFDMIKKLNPDGRLSVLCSLNCLMLYQSSVNSVCNARPIKCDFCKKKNIRQPLYHLTMSDSTLRNFCSYICVMSFQTKYPKQSVIGGSEQLSTPIPIGSPKRVMPKRSQVESTCVPVISSVQSLASSNGAVSPIQISRDVNMVSQVPSSPIPAPTPQVYQQIITKPAPAKQMKNKSVLCKPYSHTKGVSCRPHPCMKETQTDQSLNRKFLIPIPVPIYVPAPMHMFATPFPVPVPFPLPVPVPIFIPTTRNSAKGIMKEIKKIQEKIPTDPFEAELLMMAEMVAGDKKQDPTDSESEDGNDGDDNGEGTFSPENVDTSNTFGDDMLQMALKMASELEEPAVDMESVLTSNTITTSTQPAVDPNKALYASDTDDPDQVNVMAMNRGRKRSVRGARNSAGGTPSKRGRRTSGSVDVPLLPPPEPVQPRTIEVEKPDANMCLKYTFGVNAWRHWVMQKNAELEKAALTNRKIKLFKPELLQLTADELNFSLCLFVKEVRKPNGTEYAPDTIYYLCLGIQQYLFENGRIDNIFTDSYYEKFTDCLDEVAKKFAALYNDSQYIVTRVEEEHLWESKQLGAHSPHVLLSTLMFFNTKHFNLVTVEEHMQLSFSHIMKHWKRNPNTPGVAKVPGSRNVLLRFYPPQSALEANSRKKKVYEQQENEENPLRCPVKLYEFYLSKCPESVKTRNDVFYLLPERSCVPDSPVWYSTMALGKEPLMKMLHRIKMVKEINIALLTS